MCCLLLACNGQFCGTEDTTSSMLGVAVFNNSYFSMTYSSCEEAFMLTNFPPNKSLPVNLILPSNVNQTAVKVSISINKIWKTLLIIYIDGSSPLNRICICKYHLKCMIKSSDVFGHLCLKTRIANI